METDDLAAALADSATSFIADRYGTRKLRLNITEAQYVDRGVWAEMAGLGWLGLALPESLDGLGMGMLEAATLAEIMGRKAVPEPFVAAAVMPSVLLSHCAPGPLVKRAAAAIAGGQRLVTLAWQEAAGELDPHTQSTRFEAGRLSGAKCLVPIVEDDTLLLVFAKAGNGTVVLAVEANAKGVSVKRQAGGLMAMATVTFDGAPVIEATPLIAGEEADAALKCALQAGRVATAAQLTGIAAGALEKTLSYVRDRVQFGRPIGSFQTIQHRCVDYYTAVLLAGASWRNAQRAFDADPLATDATAAASAAKARGGDAAMQICRASVQMHGAMGFTEEGGVGLYLRAAMQLSTWLGNSVAHRQRFVAAAA